jgi:hypothetical protein
MRPWLMWGDSYMTKMLCTLISLTGRYEFLFFVNIGIPDWNYGLCQGIFCMHAVHSYFSCCLHVPATRCNFSNCEQGLYFMNVINIMFCLVPSLHSDATDLTCSCRCNTLERAMVRVQREMPW